jgi:hypothetical protein
MLRNETLDAMERAASAGTLSKSDILKLITSVRHLQAICREMIKINEFDVPENILMSIDNLANKVRSDFASSD